jgi:DNA polymerase III delta prime subunit
MSKIIETQNEYIEPIKKMIKIFSFQKKNYRSINKMLENIENKQNTNINLKNE